MGYDTKEAEDKRQEIHSLIATSLQESGISDANRVTDEAILQFVDITAPIVELAPIQFLTLRSGGIGGGSTRKPGNVRLNLGSLLRAIASGSLTIAGALTAQWMLVVAALLTWDALKSCLQLDISEDHACVIWAIWNDQDENNTVAKSDVFGAVNRERSRFGKQPLSTQEVDRALDDLVNMRCLQQSRNDSERWWLKEWVNVKY